MLKKISRARLDALRQGWLESRRHLRRRTVSAPLLRWTTASFARTRASTHILTRMRYCFIILQTVS